MELLTPKDPASIALPYAEQLVCDGSLDGFSPASLHEQQELAQLEQEAAALEMFGETYLVQSHRSMAIAAKFDIEDEKVPAYDFNVGLNFRGNLMSYSTLRVGKVLGSRTVRALCLTFDNVTLLPYCDRLPKSQLLYTPAFAVKNIESCPAGLGGRRK